MNEICMIFFRKIMEIMATILSGIIGAFIGTFLGALLLWRFNERKTFKTRKIALRAIELFKKYGKSHGDYSKANEEFNSSLNLVEKRSVLVALDKLGVPFLKSEDGAFNIKRIQLQKVEIDVAELDDMAGQIKEGNCDSFFFEDVDRHFTEGARIVVLRRLAVRWVDEVLSKSSCQNGTITYPNDWTDKFTWGEKLNIGTFRFNVVSSEYFQENGAPSVDRLKSLVEEISIGLWDSYITWSFDAYQNMQSATNLNVQMMKLAENAVK